MIIKMLKMSVQKRN
ncbi:hypothetical protein H0P11_00500 [Escherichia coli]|nr:hypothetical protein [Escherichia sp. 93.1462]MBB2338999.1 hypothetical protein [Escherichia sp. 93.0750]NZB75993.1 hypothetical protein [Escherichia coli]